MDTTTEAGPVVAGVQWVRLDSSFPQNPKILDLIAGKDGYRAVTVYVCSIAYSGQHGTDGRIPTGALLFIHARKVDAERLVKAGLWHEDVGGWLIHGWSEYQVLTDTERIRKGIARDAANVRWHGSKQGPA